MVLDIIKLGDDNFGRLKLPNINVKKENPFLQQLISDMFETCEYYNGVGLAAPQVGKNLNLFIVNTPKFKEVYINPVIKLNGLSVQNREGCLSFPGFEIPMARRELVEIKYFNRDWVYRYEQYNNILSIIVQHEYDHLVGKLLLD